MCDGRQSLPCGPCLLSDYCGVGLGTSSQQQLLRGGSVGVRGNGRILLVRSGPELYHVVHGIESGSSGRTASALRS